MKKATWPVFALGDLVFTKSGGTPSRENASLWVGDIPWFSGKDLKSLYLKDSIEHVSESAIGKGTRLCEPKTILVLVRGMTLMKEVPVGILRCRATFNQDVKALEPQDDSVDTRFIAYFLRAENARIRNLVTTAGHGTGRLPLEALEEYPIPKPPLPEQRKIADILSTWDVALETLDALIQAQEQRKKALMQQLLTGKTRVKGGKGKWKKTRFGEWLTESRIPGTDGSTARKITVKLYGRGVLPKQDRLVGSENTKYYVRKTGQFIYSKLDFLNGAFGIVPENLDGYESTLDLPAFDVSPSADAKWLLYYVTRPEFYTQQLGAAAGGRKARRVNPSEFLAMKIHAPDLDEQQRIAAILDTADQQLTLLRAQRTALDQQKRGLMQRLLTGKIRVKA